MSMMTLGTDEGYAEPGVPGQSNPFPFENLHAVGYRRLAENRIAGLSGKSIDFKLSQNDIVAAHRSVYTGRQAARNPRILAAFQPGGGQAYSSSEVPMSGRAATGVILEGTGKAIASPGDLSRMPGGAKSSAAGLVTVNLGTGRSNDVFVQWLTMSDSDLTTLTKYLARVTDTNNWIGIHRQSATNLRLEKNVATVVSTEADITIPSTTGATGQALGLRLTGTTCAVFLNGTLLTTVSLSAGAQGLTGTLMGALIAAGAHVYSTIGYFEAFSLTSVLGV